MNVGNYVRTEKGVIGKYNIVKTGETIPNWNGGYGYKEIEKEYIDNIIYNRFDDKIIKSSPNIIDLIEVGDIIKFKELRTHVTNDSGTKYYEDYICDIHSLGELKNIKQEIISKHIKLISVITKEKFESMEYKIGD